ncbi:hypothetical protein [Amycolatopsis nalaikhensis]|uniref:DUF2637 domain-containing protein n=1 Tax=Amycolatopsis nalaikhensis TaxID=715472 RepID=A0ABY8XQ99_9PSEU|nr:hypothetical protein [Amycolatopsis sp. 2-2]WIV57834.1 hypothetical protein QP939_03880 [Amycolatopsis sp. 2-2]
MTSAELGVSTRPAADQAAVVRAVTVIMGIVVGLTFLFGFGNVLNLALRLGVPAWVAPLVAPAVDLSILGLLLGTRHLALAGASADVLRPARRLLIFASVVTLALNVAAPLVAGEFGKAAFDAVGPLLLIGWAEVGPGFLQAISASCVQTRDLEAPCIGRAHSEASIDADEPVRPQVAAVDQPPQSRRKGPQRRTPERLLEQARQEDAAHRAAHQKPISADTLRVRLGIGATRARRLVKAVREEYQAQRDQIDVDATGESQGASSTLAA